MVPNADNTMEPIPAGMDDEQAIFVGDILATGFFAAERAEIKPGDVTAIVGAGPVGEGRLIRSDGADSAPLVPAGRFERL